MTNNEIIKKLDIEYLEVALHLQQAERRYNADRRSVSKRQTVLYIAAQQEELHSVYELLKAEPLDLLEVDFERLDEMGAEAYYEANFKRLNAHAS